MKLNTATLIARLHRPLELKAPSDSTTSGQDVEMKAELRFVARRLRRPLHTFAARCLRADELPTRESFKSAMIAAGQ